ncbi:alpha/beta hydrolase [Pseudoblastomonas halimionae]|uniref:Alpha/beta hydrolase n=1 Tax=Alteriqipengyuania halimionae TaxID=1926630 RepID=A0A6I4U5R8_9SPHN|nr:alpha/beta hydrolase [Alteriqipengyuania halimionae]MXP10245.1 alpha/beta hydrolase [Alteriqipengyuania halimionae]
MRNVLKLVSIAIALIATPLAAQTVAYEEVVVADTSVALLEDVVTVAEYEGENAAQEEPQISYETPVELETAQRAVVLWDRAQKEASKTSSDVARVNYGPFQVLGEGRVALLGMIDAQSPAQFERMLRDHPEIGILEMVEAPGTVNDFANFRLARMLRNKQIVTYVPANGSVRSGAVELFLAGARRIAHPDAEFAVHSWMDIYGREADDFAADDPVNRAYIDFYVEMGLEEAEARRFYDMTNSVPHNEALWLSADQLASYVPIEAPR